MRLRPLFIFVLLTLAFAGSVLAQSVVVTPRKVTYRRPKPMMDFKKTFVVTYPKVKAATPAVSRKIEAALSYEKEFDFTLAEEMKDLQWLEEASYEVVHNANGLLCVGLSISGTGAYPSGTTHYVTVDTKTGAKVTSEMVLTNTAPLVARLKKMQDDEVKAAKIEIKKDPDAAEGVDSFFESTNFTAEELKTFKIDSKGVTFLYDYGFPHVIQALQPPGEYFVSWSEMKKFVKPGSVFEKLAK